MRRGRPRACRPPPAPSARAVGAARAPVVHARRGRRVTRSRLSVAGGQRHDLLLAGARPAARRRACPRACTTIRSLMPISSGSSEQIIRPPRPTGPARGSARGWLPWRRRRCRGSARRTAAPRVERQPLGQHDLLLVAAGQEPDLLVEAARPQLGRPRPARSTARAGVRSAPARAEPAPDARSRAARCPAPTGPAPGPRPCGPR